MPLTIKPSSGSGSATLVSVTGTTTNDTLTLPAKTGNIITSADSGTVTQTMLGTNVAGNGPAFLAYCSSQSISASTWTKVQLNTEVFDTNNNFDPTTNYRFTPTVAGYYSFSFQTLVGSTAVARTGVALYKNGSIYVSGTATPQNNSNNIGNAGVALAYANGSTDYFELYTFNNTYATTLTSAVTASDSNYLSGALVRSA